MIGVGFLLSAMLATPNAAGAPVRITVRGGGTPAAARGTGGGMSNAVALGARWGIVTSVHRSPAHNRAVGGAANSWHLQGRAIDIARRAGVRHGEIDAAYRRAGYVLIESLDEGDHSHFAFGLPGGAPRPLSPALSPLLRMASAAAKPACPADAGALGRRRPGAEDVCLAPVEAEAKYKPIEAAP